jgi:hypoxanthine phosphoribosyltransferase
MTAPAPPRLSPIPYETFVADVQAIAAAIETDGWLPDFIVGIGRGGLVPGAYLSHRTGIPLLSVDYSSKVAGFADDLLAKLAGMSVAGQRTLFVDDINDSGATLAHLRTRLLDQGAVAGNQRIAVLLNNVRSLATVEYWSRQIDRTVDKDWFVFPWESVAPQATLVDEALSVPERLA